ncbi:Hypothetical predicted protein [Mytilus galloprovincialis]|uniref:Mutator-like transposase domain-containing protein n=1 Tax=Mytilus galloprovincialis TaxID=29158 RepID=A0A8B6GEZ9_MYTGA|nr:Hypothetical predicted protein [Mytilus galloprovincialis]
MADDKYSQRVRGKMASTGRSKKADRMRKMNSKETLRGEDHDYGAVFVEGPISRNATYLEVGENVELGSSKPWFQGRRVVELDVLARSMNSMINAGMGPSHVNNFLTGCNIPPVDASTLRKKQKELAPVIIEAAEASCKEAQREELECSECSELEGSFDAGWQKRGSGWSYNSHTGSSKGMEPDMACSMIQRLAEDGYTVGTLHADNDATTQSRLPRSIIKKR